MLKTCDNIKFWCLLLQSGVLRQRNCYDQFENECSSSKKAVHIKFSLPSLKKKSYKSVT